MNVQTQIEDNLLAALDPVYMDVVNESSGHNVAPGSETHFKVVVVSAAFEGASLLQRHRQVNALLADQLAGPVHALALHTHTEAEWRARFGEVPDSPRCRGGGAG